MSSSRPWFRSASGAPRPWVYLKVPLLWWERVLCTAAAFFLVVAVPWTDWVGFALAILAVALHYWRARQASPLPA